MGNEHELTTDEINALLDSASYESITSDRIIEIVQKLDVNIDSHTKRGACILVKFAILRMKDDISILVRTGHKSKKFPKLNNLKREELEELDSSMLLLSFEFLLLFSP